MLFNPDTGETRAMRGKEDAAEYRYFPDPDLPPLVIAQSWVAEIQSHMAELPRSMATRFAQNFGLGEYDAAQLTQSLSLARFFEESATACGQPKLCANWILGELSAALNAADLPIGASKLGPLQLAAIVAAISQGLVNGAGAKTLFKAFWNADAITETTFEQAQAAVAALIRDQDLGQMNDTAALEKIVADVLAANAKNVEEFRAGKEKAFNALVGQIMKSSKGRANPQQVNDLLRAQLGT